MIFDLHNDFPTALNRNLYAEYLDSNASAAVITQVIWTRDTERDVADLNKITAVLDRTLPRALENIGFMAESDIFAEFDFSDYIYCSLTWNYNNAFAGGALDDGKLTDKGRHAISVVLSNGCVIDTAHLNKQSFYDVCDMTDRVICSHTGFNGHRRSLDREQIRLLIERNAIIGLCTVRAFTDASSAREWTDRVDRFLQEFGDDNLSVGTDFYGSDDIPFDLACYGDFVTVYELLAARGYSDNTIRKIFYENANTYFSRRYKQ